MRTFNEVKTQWRKKEVCLRLLWTRVAVESCAGAGSWLQKSQVQLCSLCGGRGLTCSSEGFLLENLSFQKGFTQVLLSKELITSILKMFFASQAAVKSASPFLVPGNATLPEYPLSKAFGGTSILTISFLPHADPELTANTWANHRIILWF